MSGTLAARVSAALDRPIDPAVAAFAEQLGHDAGAEAVLFYGSNLRTGSLEGVLDFYILLPGKPERGLWPKVSYHERDHDGVTLRAKVATMTLAMFASAARGETVDTTIWARFVQPSGLAWLRDEMGRSEVEKALTSAAVTAARLAVAVGPARAPEKDFWRALFQATYAAELRVEPAGRENSILAAHPGHFDGLLPLALLEANIPYLQDGRTIEPRLSARERRVTHKWWARRRWFGKPLNVIRLARAMATFEGGMRYIAWKVERHTGLPVPVTPMRERLPLLAVPRILRVLWQSKRGQAKLTQAQRTSASD